MAALPEWMNRGKLNEQAYQEYLGGTLECKQAEPLFAEHHRRVMDAEAASEPRPSVISTVELLCGESRGSDDRNAVPEAAHQRKQGHGTNKEREPTRASGNTCGHGVSASRR